MLTVKVYASGRRGGRNLHLQIRHILVNSFPALGTDGKVVRFNCVPQLFSAYPDRATQAAAKAAGKALGLGPDAFQQPFAEIVADHETPFSLVREVASSIVHLLDVHAYNPNNGGMECYREGDQIPQFVAAWTPSQDSVQLSASSAKYLRTVLSSLASQQHTCGQPISTTLLIDDNDEGVTAIYKCGCSDGDSFPPLRLNWAQIKKILDFPT